VGQSEPVEVGAVGSFEVVGFSSMDELWARLGLSPGRPVDRWPFEGPWLPAGATDEDLDGGWVQLGLRVDRPWSRLWPEVKGELGRLGRVMGVLVEARQEGEVIPVEVWGFTRGVHRAAAWTLGVTDVMPLEVGQGRVTPVAIKAVYGAAMAAIGSPAEWDAAGVVEWLAWLDGETETIPYPVE